MKKFIAIILSVVVCVSLFSFGVIAGENEISVLIDCKPVTFDVAPTTINDRTMVPMRAIFEALGATVEWDESTQTITATTKSDIIDLTITLRINYSVMQIKIGDTSPQWIGLDVAPVLKDQRTLVPVRAISNGFGYNVGWDEKTQTVSIVKDSKNYKMLYAPDGRAVAFPTSEIDAQLAVGWYTVPVQMLYAPGKSQVFKTFEVEEQLKVGWFKTYEEAEASVYAPPKEPEVLSAPFDTIEEMRQATSYVGKCYKGGNFYVGKNSADGVFLHWAAKNVSNKTIKYLTFTLEFYNAVGDLTLEEHTNKAYKTIRLTGPIGPQKAFYIKDIVGYSTDCQSIKITDIKIDYMDGTSYSGYYGYKTEWYRHGVAF